MNWSLTAKRLRLPLGFALGIGYLVFARPDTRRLLVGALIALAGVAVRAWASGHIMKNDRLATSGPYAYTRNPLYFGSFLIAVGFALAAHWALIALVIAFWIVIYRPTMEREKANIRSRFPGAYAEYESNVPTFFPRLTPWRGPREGGGQGFSPALYLKHGEWKALLVYVLAITWLAIRSQGVGR